MTSSGRIFIKYRRSKTSKKNDSQYKKKIQNILTRRSRISNKVNLKMVERRKFLLVFSCSFSVNVVKLHATKKECELGKRLIYKSAFSVITRNKETSNHAYFISLHCTTLPSVSSSILASKTACYMCLWGNLHRLSFHREDAFWHTTLSSPFFCLLVTWVYTCGRPKLYAHKRW